MLLYKKHDFVDGRTGKVHLERVNIIWHSTAKTLAEVVSIVSEAFSRKPPVYARPPPPKDTATSKMRKILEQEFKKINKEVSKLTKEQEIVQRNATLIETCLV